MSKTSSVIAAEPQVGYHPAELEKPIKKESVTNTNNINSDKKIEVLESTKKSEITKLTASTNRRKSAFSLKSIQEKAEQIANQSFDEPLVALPESPFTEKQFFEVWEESISHFTNGNQKIFVSVLKADTPKLKDHIISLTMPNDVMAHSFQKGKLELLTKIRKALNNYKIDFEIVVNEARAKEFIYTPQEKYQELKKRNPNIEFLKKTFKLDF